MLPGLVEAAVDGTGRAPRRTVRDWAVDVACIVLAAAMASVSLLVPTPRLPIGVTATTTVLACASLLLRRRAPVLLTVVLIVASIVVPAVSGASLIALFTAAVHRRLATALALVVLAGTSAMVQLALGLTTGVAGYWLGVGAAVVISLLVVGWGMAVRGRRELVLLMAERLHRLRLEQDSRVREARQAVRDGIARDLHDSLAHRLSLISMTAGTLDYRSAVPTRDLDDMVEILRWNARQGLGELRQVVTVLRRPDGQALPGQYQPGAVFDLVAEARASGQQVELVWTLPVHRLRRAVGDSLFRCVQEGLSNARKHAADRKVTLVGRMTEDGRAEMVMTNSTGPGRGVDGAGTGLHGLRERVNDAGGRMSTELTDGVFRLRVDWPVASDGHTHDG